jgi:hypothetical protein
LEFSLPNVFPFEIEIGPDRKPSSSRVWSPPRLWRT